MPIEQWSDQILLLNLGDEPQFSDDLYQVAEQLDQQDYDVVMNFADVTQVNSTSLGELLKLRQRLVVSGGRLRICSVSDSIWGVLMTTSLDKVFQFAPDVPSALASLQLDGADASDEEEE